MNLKLMLTVLGSVFMAELGDKTQLAILGFAAENRSWFSVFLGGSLGLILSTLFAVAAGSLLRKYIPVETLHWVGGVLFIGIGVWMIARG